MKPGDNSLGNWTGRIGRPQGLIVSEEKAKADSGRGLLLSLEHNFVPWESDFRKLDFKAGVSSAKERLKHAGETPALHSKVLM